MRYKRKIFLEGYIDHFLLPRNQENALVFIREFVKRIEQICAHALFMNFRLYEYNAVITREYDSIVIRDKLPRLTRLELAPSSPLPHLIINITLFSQSISFREDLSRFTGNLI